MKPKPGPYLSSVEKEFLKAHFQARGLWQKFVDLREALKERDISGAAAWLQTATSMGYIHHEDPRRGHFEGVACARCDVLKKEEESGQTSKVVTMGTANPCVTTPDQASIEQGGFSGTDPNGIRTGDIDEMAQVASAGKKVEPRSKFAWGGTDLLLMPKEMALAKPRQDITADIEWVVEHLGVADMIPEDAPSTRAWSLFTEARSGLEGFRMVMQHHQKMMPTGKQLDAEAAFGDLGEKKLAEFKAWLDSSKQTGLLTNDAVQQEGAEVVPTERVVSRRDLAPRG